MLIICYIFHTCVVIPDANAMKNAGLAFHVRYRYLIILQLRSDWIKLLPQDSIGSITLHSWPGICSCETASGCKFEVTWHRLALTFRQCSTCWRKHNEPSALAHPIKLWLTSSVTALSSHITDDLATIGYQILVERQRAWFCLLSTYSFWGIWACAPSAPMRVELQDGCDRVARL